MTDYEAICPGCGKAIGDHTIRGYAECLEAAGFNYELPFEKIPGGSFELPDAGGTLAGELTVAAGLLPTALGVFPVLRFVFVGAGDLPMERRTLDPITLVMDERGLESVARLVRNSVKSACDAARRAS